MYKEKAKIRNDIINAVKNRGGRFLVQKRDWSWEVPTDKKLHKSISQSLCQAKTSQNKLLHESQAKPSLSKDAAIQSGKGSSEILDDRAALLQTPTPKIVRETAGSESSAPIQEYYQNDYMGSINLSHAHASNGNVESLLEEVESMVNPNSSTENFQNDSISYAGDVDVVQNETRNTANVAIQSTTLMPQTTSKECKQGTPKSRDNAVTARQLSRKVTIVDKTSVDKEMNDVQKVPARDVVQSGESCTRGKESLASSSDEELTHWKGDRLNGTSIVSTENDELYSANEESSVPSMDDLPAFTDEVSDIVRNLAKRDGNTANKEGGAWEEEQGQEQEYTFDNTTDQDSNVPSKWCKVIKGHPDEYSDPCIVQIGSRQVVLAPVCPVSIHDDSLSI